MGIFSAASAIGKIQRIKNGGIEKISISDIATCITSLPDAKMNLSATQFKKISDRYFKFQKCTTKMAMDLNAYLDTCLKIIKEYDAIAPYELYSGGNETEFKFMLEDIRKETLAKGSNIIDTLHNYADISIYDYTSNIKELTGLAISVPYDVAKAFMGIVEIFEKKGKETALEYFDKLLMYEINGAYNDFSDSPAMYIPVLCGALTPYGIVSRDESEVISKNYTIIASKETLNRMNIKNDKQMI